MKSKLVYLVYKKFMCSKDQTSVEQLWRILWTAQCSAQRSCHHLHRALFITD